MNTIQVDKLSCVEKSELANNTNTPQETLIILAKDEKTNVRSAVENNPSSTREIIQTKRAFEYLLSLSKVAH